MPKEMNKQEIVDMISHDANNLISSLLLYKIAAVVLTSAQANAVVDGAADTIVDQLSNHFDKNIVEKVVKDTAENTKDIIGKM